MIQETGPELNKCGAARGLTGPARRVHLAVLTAFTAHGLPPGRGELERLARTHGADPDAVLAELQEADVLAFAADGEIRAAYPFSPVPTPILVSWPGGPACHAMCAIDALGLSAMLGRPVTITAAEPDSGRIITVKADHDRARWNPRSAVVFAGSAGDASSSADRSCGYISFFVTARAARAWARRHPEVTGTVLRREEALSCGIAEFWTFLKDPARAGGQHEEQ